MENIAVYGGSFNPPTKAHAQVISKVLEITDIEKVIFTPDGDRFDKNHKTSLLDRKRIIEIFYEVLKRNGLNVDYDPYFLDGNNGDYTTTMQVREYFKNKLGFYPWHIFGVDVVPAMPNWRGNIDNIIEQKLKKIFISRPGFSFNPNGFSNYLLLDIPEMLDVSSTMAREMIINKQKVDSILFPEVIEYIEKKGLYAN